MNVAIVTDAISASYYFPVWYRYYVTHVPSQNIFVFTYAGAEEEFEKYNLGAIKSLLSPYNDDLRQRQITEFVRELLDTFDIVLRVDVDEFVVPEPRLFPSLGRYLAELKADYVTAQGYDIIQSINEPDLKLDVAILPQRQFAYALEAMNKTCVTRVPLNWGRGFHYCSEPPRFDALYLFHAKRADIKLQQEWNLKMREGAGQDAFLVEYYSWQPDQILDYHRKRLSLPIIEGEDSLERRDFEDAFLNNIRYSEQTGLYEGNYDIEPVNILIPERFKTAF